MRNLYALLIALLSAFLLSAPLPAQAPATITACITQCDEPIALPASLWLNAGGQWDSLTPIQTNSDGCSVYELPNVPGGIDYLLAIPVYDDVPLNGVSMWDAVLISRHVLGLEPLNSQSKMVAADANNSTSVTVLDITEIYKLILGEYLAFPHGITWQFFPPGYEPLNPFSPIPLIDTILPPFDTLHFIGAKRGDVSCSAVFPVTPAAENLVFGGNLCLNIPARTLAPGETADVPVRLRDGGDLLGLQLDLAVKPPFFITGFTPGVLNDPFNFRVDTGARRITCAWIAGFTEFHFSAGDTLFLLKIGTTQPASTDTCLVLDKTRILPEGYRGAPDSRLSVELCALTSTDAPGTTNMQVHCSPNPARNRTVLTIEPLEAGAGPWLWEIFDWNGRTLLQGKESGIGAGGIEINTESLVPGLYGYRVRIGNRTAVGKLVRL